ncbi:hypothetical protein C8J56DRAFT_1054242 [Mycena floridula]|nr:hypothetical protein C8J56DRAFT_1054242 [Mycena floridula]
MPMARNNLSAFPLGAHHRSPIKRRNAKRTKSLVKIPGQEEKVQALRRKMEALESQTNDEAELSDSVGSMLWEVEEKDQLERGMEAEEEGELETEGRAEYTSDDDYMPDAGYRSDEMLLDPIAPVDNPSPVRVPTEEAPSEKWPKQSETIISDTQAANDTVFKNWQRLLPKFQEPYLLYRNACHGLATVPPIAISTTCDKPSCPQSMSDIVCLYYDHYFDMKVKHCQCQSIQYVLVANGLFPASPSAPVMAVSIALLEFYRALFERSCDAVHALAAALNTVYRRRGHHMLNSDNEPYKEPFRRGLGHAIQWYDCLFVQTEAAVDKAVDECDAIAQALKIPPTPHFKSPLPSTSSPSTLRPYTVEEALNNGLPTVVAEAYSAEVEKDMAAARALRPTPDLSDVPSESIKLDGMSPGECHRILQQRCPACFGGAMYGRSFNEGGDIQVAADGNFHHRHTESKSTNHPFHNAKHFIPKSFVDAVGDRIEVIRQRPPKVHTPVVPDSAIDGCQESHHAAKGDQAGLKGKQFDDNGLMALVCCHDIPLFFANINTPGEQQKYVVALLEYLFSMIPQHASVVLVYDIGCVVDRSFDKYDLLPLHILSQIIFITSAMHAYGHGWTCQLVYNPRLQRGLGLTDGEGVERLWSRLRKLIGIERYMARNGRIWLLNRQADSIGDELRDGLGDFINTRLKKGVRGQGKKAQQILDDGGISLSVLREQWELQRKSQLSVSSAKPAKIKKELEKVISLLADIEGLDATIENARKAVANARNHAQKAIAAARDSPTKLTAKRENKRRKAFSDAVTLFTSLKACQDAFKEQVSSLYDSLNLTDEFDELAGINLDFAKILVSLRDLKVTIRKRAIASFFEWERLDQSVGGRHQTIGTRLHQQTRKAIAKRKPTLLAYIRKYNMLVAKLQDWPTSETNIACPLPLPTELQHLRDSDDLMQDVWTTPDQPGEPRARWLDDATLTALEVARTSTRYSHLSLLIRERYTHLLQLKPRWTNELASAIRFDNAVETALKTAHRIATLEVSTSNWITAVRPPLSNIELVDSRSSLIGHNETVASDLLGVETILVLSDDEDPPLSEDEELEMSDDESVSGGEVEVPQTQAHFAHILYDWVPPVESKDVLLMPWLEETFPSPSTPWDDATAPRRIPKSTIDFGREDLEILVTPDRWLNSGCINGLAALLQLHIRSRFHCILSSWALTCTADVGLWNLTWHQCYWEKDIWIIPIHRIQQQHWVLCVVLPQSHSHYLFDSYAAPAKSWSQDLDKIVNLITRLVGLATSNGHSIDVDLGQSWVARPVLLEPVQSNGHDCGLWVLAVIAAILRGFCTPGITERLMRDFREHLLIGANSVPLTVQL